MYWKTKKVPVDGHSVQSFSIGEGSEAILLVHGGPGAPSDYMREAHAFLPKAGYHVITWDQLGCGKSDKPESTSLWKIDRFTHEMEAIRKAYGLKRVHILGTAWGGMLSIEYALYYPKEIASLILVNTSPSITLLEREHEQYRKILKAQGSADLQKKLYESRLCRLAQWPKSLTYATKNISQPVLTTLYGPNLFDITGNLKNWERMRDIHVIDQPTLILSGEHYCSSIATQVQSHLQNSRYEILKGASRTPYFETPANYQSAVLSFLANY